eukprot:gene27435-27697_t
MKRGGLGSRYEREVSGHDGHEAHPHAPVATPAPYVGQHAVSVGLPGSPGQVFTTPISSVTGAGANVFTGAVTTVPVTTPVMVQQPMIGVPLGGITVINNPPPAGSPCPVCGKPLGDQASHKPHEHHGPPAAPRFSKATPEVFRDGFKPLWDAAQADQAAYVV